MGKRTDDAPDDRLDGFMAGELSAPQQRELAQAALDNPELFDTLTAAALLKETVRASDAAPAVDAPVRANRARVAMIAGGAMAAAAVLAWLAIRPPAPPARDTVAAPATTARLREPAEPAPASAAPVFLRAQLDDGGGQASAFRSVERGSRLPKEAGEVTSVDNGDIEVNLGSLDGVENGSTLRIVARNDGAATLQLDAVFRERSRGHLTAGAAHPGDRAEVSRAQHVNALLDHARSRAAAGDFAPATRLAELAVARAGGGPVEPPVRRRALAALGALEYRAGAVEDAARHLRLAVAELEKETTASPADRAGLLDALATALIDRREYTDAERMLQAAAPQAAGRTAVRIANNLGALAALRGDRAAAESHYRSALELAAMSPDLEPDARVIRGNIDGLRVAGR